MSQEVDGSTARELGWLTETYHAVVYFAPETKDAYSRAGLKGGWMGYFASRSAAMGPVSPEVVTATFYNFHPAMVHRALPDAWGFSTPERVLAARYEVADAALRRALGGWIDSEEAREAAALARRAAHHCDGRGRPLFAAHSGLPWPEPPHLELWHACTLLREFRGDGHVTSLVAAGLAGAEVHILTAAWRETPQRSLQSFRGWSDDEWAAAASRLEERGLMADGQITDAGRALRDDIEERTDLLALQPWRALGADACRRLRTLLVEPVKMIVEGGGVLFPNPIGLPNPVEMLRL